MRIVRCLVALIAVWVLALPALSPAMATQADDFAAAGLVSGTEYVSPQHGYEITWDAAWGVDPTRVDPVLWLKPELDRHGDIPVYTSESNAYDRLDLWLPDLDARLRVIGQTTANGGIHVPSMASPNNSLGGDADTLIEIDDPDESIVVHRHAMNDGGVLLSYNQLVPGRGEDFWLWIQLVAPEDQFAGAFDRAGSDISSDAFAFGGGVTARDILDASAGQPVVPVSEWGITSATTWVSPRFGVEIEWDDALTTYENLNGIRDAGDSYWLTFGPKFDDPWTIETGVFANDRYESIDDIFDQTVHAYEAQEQEILIAGIEGDRAIFLWRSVTNDTVFISYTEYGLSADGEAVTWAEIQGKMSDDDVAFSTRFALAAGAISIEGIPFAETYDPAAIIAAAYAPLDD